MQTQTIQLMKYPNVSTGYQNLSEGADRVGGQLRGDKECPFEWRNQIWQSLEEGAGKRCSECAPAHEHVKGFLSKCTVLNADLL